MTGITQNKQKCLIFIVVSSKKKNERLGVAKNSLDRIEKEKYSNNRK